MIFYIDSRLCDSKLRWYKIQDSTQKHTIISIIIISDIVRIIKSFLDYFLVTVIFFLYFLIKCYFNTSRSVLRFEDPANQRGWPHQQITINEVECSGRKMELMVATKILHNINHWSRKYQESIENLQTAEIGMGSQKL